MAESYEDLTERITDRYGISRIEVAITLRHLDIFPDQVPGRTITESEAARLWYDANNSVRDAWPMSLLNHGITVIPDPEPTNAEKATADLETWGMLHTSALELGPWLAGQGWTKAPGGDDD